MSCYAQDTLEQKITRAFELNEQWPQSYHLWDLDSKYTEFYIDKAQEFHKDNKNALFYSYNYEVFIQSYKNKAVADKLSSSLTNLLKESRGFYYYLENGLDTLADKLYFDEVCDNVILLKRNSISEEMKNILISNFEKYYYDDHGAIPLLLGAVFEKNKPELIQKIKNQNITSGLNGIETVHLGLTSKASIARMGSEPERIELINAAKEYFALKKDPESLYDLEKYVKLLGYLKDKEATDILINELMTGEQTVLFWGRFGMERCIVDRLTTVIKDFPLQPKRVANVFTANEVETAKKWLKKHKNNYKISNEYLR
jgi:hypothetical protein